MKKYLLFYYRGFYPDGAFNDYLDSFDTSQDVFEYIQNLPSSLKEDVQGGCLTFQILNTNSFSLLTLDEIDDILNILCPEKYTLVKRNLYFDIEVEEYRLEDEL